MSSATDYLTQQIQQAEKYRPAVTFATCQRSTTQPGTAFGPGIASYGWGWEGGITKDANGNANGLSFARAKQWFSDRHAKSEGDPTESQQFAAAAQDSIDLTFVVEAGDAGVGLTAVLESWGKAEWRASTNNFDAASQQLIFSIPGAGAGAPPAVMLVSFAPANIGGTL